MPRLIQVIESSEKRGQGLRVDPVRDVTQYHTTDGELLAERDPIEPPERHLLNAAITLLRTVEAPSNQELAASIAAFLSQFSTERP